MSNSLDGLRILVTRPAAQATALAEKLQQAGARPLLFPLLEIRPWQSPDLPARLQQLDHYDLAIFVSRNAVDHACEQLAARGLALPATLNIATVGKGTAEQIQARLHRPADLVPSTGADSEALLALPELADMRGRKVIVFRGRGGRETLAETLRQRGATVDYAEVYQRSLPDTDTDQLDAALREARLDVILITSNQALDNLTRLTQEPALFQQQLLVIHPRQAEHALELGFVHPAIIAPGGSDTAIIGSLTRFRAGKAAG